MKKILLVATSLVVLSTVAGAAAPSHNYVGAGLGWTMAKANVSNLANMSSQAAGRGSVNVTKKGEDNAPIGKIFLGRSFNKGSINLLTEVSLALDTSNAKGTAVKVNRPFFDGTFNSSLKRKGILGLSLGLSGNMVRDVALYGKASLLVARFKASSRAKSIVAGGIGGLINNGSNIPFKNKTAYGFGLTVGASKPITEKISLGVDYTFEMYQKIEAKLGALSAGGRYDYKGTFKPQYHTVMFNLAKKI